MTAGGHETAAADGRTSLPRPGVLVAALTIVAGGLGFMRLGRREITFDESYTIKYIRSSWGDLWHVVTQVDPNMSVYYGALKLWSGLFGLDAVALRSLSVIAAALCVPVVYAIGARLFGVSAGLLAALLLAINVFFLSYAQQARAYALVTLLTALSTLFYLVELERPRRLVEVGYVATSVLAFYTHFFVVWVLAVHVLALVARREWRVATRSWLACYAAMALLAAPMVYWVVTLGGDPVGWLEAPDLGAIPATYAQLAGDSFLQLAAIGVLVALALRRAAGSEPLLFGLTFTAAWAFLPALGAYALSQLKPAFLAKYLIVSLPAMMLLAAGAVSCLRPRKLALAAAALLAVLALPALWTAYVHGFPYYS